MKIWKVLAGVSVVAVAAAGVYAADVFPREIAPMAAIDTASFTDDQIALGENLANLGDCAACHTPRGARGMEGGVGLPTPFGVIYSTNITPDPETGIGNWSFAAFERAMRSGIDRAGNHLYPAFPYDHFAGTTRDDLEALYQFLMTQDPVRADRKTNELGFPFSVRPLLAGWKLLFHRETAFVPNPDFTDEENRGAYLAETLGHCSACHSPRNALGAVTRSAGLAGGAAEGWLAPPLGAVSLSPLGWDIDDYADYLFDGWSEHHGIAGGPMTAVVDHLRDADEDDVFAIAAWLARITPAVDKDARAARVTAIKALDLAEGFDPGFGGQQMPQEVQRGAQVFKDNCVKCHKQRISDTQPVSLGLTYAANAPAPTNVFNAVLYGIEPGLGATARKMQPVALSAENLAEVAAFVRWHFTDQPAWTNLAAQASAAVKAKAAPGH
jgi:mono/diheme cytochrome c family protein